MITTFGKNAMLDTAFAPKATRISLHSAWPGPDGLQNELSGGSYARQPISWASASGGVMNKAGGDITFSVPAGDVQFYALWNDLITTECHAIAAVGAGTDVWSFQVNTAANRIIVVGHGLSDGDQVVLMGSGTAPSGLTVGTLYYVLNATADDFQVEASPGGGAIPIGSAGSPQLVISRAQPASYAAPGQFIVQSASISMEL